MSFFIGWNKSRAEESIVPPRRAKRHRAGRTAAGRTRPGAGVTRRTCVSEQVLERKLCRRLKPVAPPEHVSTKMMFMTPGEIRRCSSEELTKMLAETEKEYKYWRKLARVRDAVSAHRLEQMRDLLAREQLKTWRSKNGLDRDDSWIYGARPLSPQEFTAKLWAEVNELKAAISMPVRGGPLWQEYKRNIIRKIERDEVSDEDFAVIKRLVETRDRDAARVTVTQVSTVQHCSPIPQTPEPPSDVCFNLENNEGEMDPKLKENPKSSSAGTGLETPGQQCTPNEGVWEHHEPPPTAS